MGCFMNRKNLDLFFNEDDEETAVVTLTDENGNDVDAEIIAAVEIEELGKEFVAVMPQEETEDFQEGEALILEYSEDGDGEPVFTSVDEEEYELVAQAFNQFFAEQLDDFDEDDEDVNEDVLDDISSYLPGVSFKKE